jgi:Family of unknown function (DUF6153)
VSQVRNQAISGRLPRLGWVLLLACVALGMAAMHTLGHGTHIGMAMTASAHRTTASAAMPMQSQPIAHPRPGPGGTHEGGTAAWSVCLAVLGAVAAVVLPALLLRQRPGRTGATAHVMGRARPSRPPPRHPPSGLLLADLSVLRI